MKKTTRSPASIRTAVIFLICAILPVVAPHPADLFGGSDDTPSYSGFSAIDPSRSHFIVFGDTRGKSPWEFWLENTGKMRAEILREIVRGKPAFVINLGDLVLSGGSSRAWTDFDRLHTGIRQEGIPYFPILGNHELQGDMEDAFRHYFTRFPDLKNRRWYSFQWKQIGFIMLDSNVSLMTPEERSRQLQWYKEELNRFEADTRVEHVIVCTHEPPFTNRLKTPLGRNESLDFAEPFLKFKKTRLLFSGHVHSYERFLVGGKHFIVSGGGGAPRGKLVTDPSRRKHEDQFQGEELRFFHICVVDIQGNTLRVRVLRADPDGSFSEADRLTIPPQS